MTKVSEPPPKKRNHQTHNFLWNWLINKVFKFVLLLSWCVGAPLQPSVLSLWWFFATVSLTLSFCLVFLDKYLLFCWLETMIPPVWPQFENLKTKTKVHAFPFLPVDEEYVESQSRRRIGDHPNQPEHHLTGILSQWLIPASTALKSTSSVCSVDAEVEKWDNHNAIARGWRDVNDTYRPVTFRKLYGVKGSPQPNRNSAMY